MHLEIFLMARFRSQLHLFEPVSVSMPFSLGALVGLKGSIACSLEYGLPLSQCCLLESGQAGLLG